MQTLQIQEVETDSLEWAPIALLSATVLAISVLSGFQSTPVPYELTWQFSPLGFLMSALKDGLPSEFLDLPTANYFRGPSGWSLDYATVFAKTCALEAPFYFLCLKNESLPRRLQVLMSSNFLTHPIVFFVFPLLFSKYVPAALSAELFAALAEMAFVGGIVAKTEGARRGARAAIWIVMANLFSWEAGMFIT
jgi:hypothetical protein